MIAMLVGFYVGNSECCKMKAMLVGFLLCWKP